MHAAQGFCFMGMKRMRYVYKDADPAKILEVAERLSDAERQIAETILLANGCIKTEWRDTLAKTARQIRFQVVSLEYEFAQRCVQVGLVARVDEVPLFGGHQHVERVRKWFVEKGGEA